MSIYFETHSLSKNTSSRLKITNCQRCWRDKTNSFSAFNRAFEEVALGSTSPTFYTMLLRAQISKAQKLLLGSVCIKTVIGDKEPWSHPKFSK